MEALLHGHAFDGDEGYDVGGADARVRALMLGEIDEGDGLFHRAERGFGDRGGRPDEGENAAVMIDIGFAIEQHDSGDRSDGCGDRVDFRGVASFRKVRNTFNQLSRHSIL